MARDIERWLKSERGVACRCVPGVLRSTVVPDGACAMLLTADSRVVPAGTPLEAAAILFRSRELEVDIVVEGLHDRDGVSGNLTATLVLEPPTTRTAMLLLRDAFLQENEEIDASDLAPYFSQRVRPGLLRVLIDRPWDGAEGFVARLRKGEFLPTLLREPLFDIGLSLLRVLEVEVTSPDLEQRRQRREELRHEAERVRERLEFLELWKKEEQGEALARAELEQLAAHLQKQGTLRSLEQRQELTQAQLEAERAEAQSRGQLRRALQREHLAEKMSIDEERLEHEIRMAKRLETALQEAGLIGAIGIVDDPAAKEKLVQLLIEKDMTPEQIAARQQPLEISDLEQRFATFANELRAELRGGRAPEWARHLPSLDHIWLAAGLAVYRISGDHAFSGGEPRPVLPPEDIGYLRSVRVDQGGEHPLVLIGAQGGVATYEPRGSHWSVYRFHKAPRGRGGANSVVATPGRLLATHSELGLQGWSRREGVVQEAFLHQASSGPPPLPGDTSRLHDQRIVAGVSTRGACRGPGDRVLFAHGNEVLAVPQDEPHGSLQSLGTLPESVTALASSGDRILAGTRDGQLYRYEQGRWLLCRFSTRGPVFDIMPASAGRGGSAGVDRVDPVGWIVGARECGVHVLDVEGSLISDYRSRYPIRWVAAGRQGVLGVDRFGQHLLLWSWDDPRAPIRRIRIPDQIQSLAVQSLPCSTELDHREEGRC